LSGNEHQGQRINKESDPGPRKIFLLKKICPETNTKDNGPRNLSIPVAP